LRPAEVLFSPLRETVKQRLSVIHRILDFVRFVRASKVYSTHPGVAATENPALESRLQTNGIAARWRYGISREQTCEIDEVKPIVEVLGVELQAHSKGVLFPDVGSHG